MIIKGVVQHGRSLGRKLGFPTANIALEGSLSIVGGVYSSRIVVGGRSYRAVSNVGTRPTVEGGAVANLESHILDFEGDLYGHSIEVELLDKLRDEIHFESLEALQKQITRDIEIVKNLK